MGGDATDVPVGPGRGRGLGAEGCAAGGFCGGLKTTVVLVAGAPGHKITVAGVLVP